MPVRVLPLGLFVVLGLAAGAEAHPRGFHKRLQGVVGAERVELLVSVELDGGRKALELRRGADVDLDGTLSEAEHAALKQRLTMLALHPLDVRVGGQPLIFGPAETRLSLRGDPRVGEKGVSLLVRVQAPFPGALVPGMRLILTDESPDGSHVGVEVQPQLGSDGGVSGESQRAELKRGERFEMVLRP